MIFMGWLVLIVFCLVKIRCVSRWFVLLFSGFVFGWIDNIIVIVMMLIIVIVISVLIREIFVLLWIGLDIIFVSY